MGHNSVLRVATKMRLSLISISLLISIFVVKSFELNRRKGSVSFVRERQKSIDETCFRMEAQRTFLNTKFSLSPFTRYNQRPTRVRILSSKDWDSILSDTAEDNDPKNPIPHTPSDMRYVPRNCQRQNQNFLNIREAAGKELTNDVYAREPDGSDTFWFVGKVARVSNVSIAQAVSRQWPLIVMHAANLRPVELFPARRSLELWVAPGDSEMEVAYNNPELMFITISRDIEGSESINVNMVGFQGEMYHPGEKGFRTWRLPDGRPAKPQLQSYGGNDCNDTRAPTEEEMAKIQDMLKGKDINAIYEEQERRNRR